MLADGAYLNVSASRALETILGGKESPKQDECRSDIEFAEWIRSTPTETSDRDYGEASRFLAKLYLMVLEEGCSALGPPDVWLAVKQRWPELAKQAAGGTGFMHGWAFNAARHVLNLPPVANPALIEIEI